MSEKQNEPRPMRGAWMWPMNRIKPTPNQSRTEFVQSEIEEIAQSIRTLRERNGGLEGSGILHAILARPETGAIQEDGSFKPGSFLCITAGEKRWRAAQLVGLTEIPVVIESETEDAAYEAGIFENLYRSNPNPMDFARALQTWMNRRDPPLSVRKAAAKLGKDHNWVQLSLVPLRVDEDCKVLINERPDSLTAAQRINTIRDAPDVRKMMIDLVAAGFSYDSAKDFREMRRIADDEVRTPLIQTVYEQMSKGKVDYSTINFKIRTALGTVALIGDEPEPILPDDEVQRVFGSLRDKSVPRSAQINLENALESLVMHASDTHTALKNAPMTSARKKALLERLGRLQKITVEIEHLLNGNGNGQNNGKGKVE